MTDKESTEMEELLAKQFKEYWDGMRSFYGKIKLCDMKFVEAVANLAFGWGFRNAYMMLSSKNKKRSK
jgi:hypothetical protein